MPPLGHAALLHDIGKIAVADSILLKPGKLTEEEWLQMRRHVLAGEEMLNRIPFLRPSAPVVRHHHERYDGKGYPNGVAGEQIPLGARLFSLADTLDAMTSDRVYRKATGLREVYAEVSRERGTQFDPQIADLFLKTPEGVWQQVRDSLDQQLPSGNVVTPNSLEPSLSILNPGCDPALPHDQPSGLQVKNRGQSGPRP
jgi:HD-GYP domain-containing protein (c-di-GMP phosphodiesterase class II)